MFYALEAFVLAYLIYISRVILKRGTAGNLLATGIFALAAVASFIGFSLAEWILAGFMDNPILRVTFSVLVSLSGYFGVTIVLGRKVRADDRAKVKALEVRLSLPRAADRAISGLLLAALLVLAGVFLLFFVNLLAEKSASTRERIERHTVVLHALLLPEKTPARSDAKPGMTDEQALELQGTFLSRFKAGLAAGRDLIAEKTGTKAFMEQIQALREVVNLSEPEKRWLIQTTPELNNLLNHPSIVAVMDDRRVLDLIEQVGRGSPTAIYQLGEEPSMVRLLEDPTVLKAIRAIDLKDLRNKVRARRKAGLPVPASWSVSSMARTTELDARLGSRAGWKAFPFGEVALAWPDDVPIALARTRFSAARPVELHARIRTSAHLTFWVNGRNLKLSSDGEWKEVRFTTPVGNVTAVMMLDFRGATGRRACEVRLIAPKGTGGVPSGR